MDYVHLEYRNMWPCPRYRALITTEIHTKTDGTQLAVVGDQSSGKSSVLESISELPFPRDSGLCTRFATQIIFRRSPESSIKITIIPGPDRDKQEADKLKRYVKDGLTTMMSDVFLEILEEVCQLMGIPGPGETLGSSQSTFSDDMLSIELCGPDKQNLSILDIPGIFRTPTEGVTTEDDIALVRIIMYRHIKDERTIILAVIPSNTDIATQEILSIAKVLDPKGLRTLGVLTKPDLIDDGTEQNVMDLVNGKRNPLHYGYCIVRNRGQSELSSNSKTRGAKEKEFFSAEPWSRLDPDRVGTPALQRRLQQMLIGLTRREFPKVQIQISKELSSCRKHLESLGPSRESTDQQRRLLIELAKRFQGLASNALDACYFRDEVLINTPQLRLATLAVERMERYSADIEQLGHTINFDSGKDVVPEEKTSVPHSASEDLNDLSDRHVEDAEEAENKKLQYPEILDFIQSYERTARDEDGSILDWIGDEYRKARGFGLADIGPSILPTIWQEQSKNWRAVTLEYIGDTIVLVHDFTVRALAHICPNEEQLVGKYCAARDHVDFIIKVEHSGTPLTMNHYFNENLQKCKSRRLQKMLEKHAEDSYDRHGRLLAQANIVKLDQVMQSMAMGNSDHTIQDIHDILESYYKVARKRFVDTICMQGSDFHLLNGPGSPLRIFGTSFVGGLSEVQLDLIAGEDVSTRQLRKNLETEIDALEKGKKLLGA
ncbi:Interferon-inducible Mx [Hyphodiscus hymeniophilus]|uniref:Interferon-inducible Mx n=1 Tax=Hyphodiscus hymeniophilus TaxID=353542 RepID=A0A9P6VE32_9HELO|nr:Interferon-inducible Mx [Hyphodiscus hymeniophilus]